MIETDPSGDINASNTFGPLGLVLRHVASGNGHGFFAYDPSGNTVQQISSTGSVLNTDLYDAYGNNLTSNTQQTDPYGFGAQWGYFTDYTTGVTLAGHRYYDPAAGKWLNRDPIGYGGGLNLYGYVWDDPENLADPAGTMPIPVGPVWATAEGLEVAGGGADATGVGLPVGVVIGIAGAVVGVAGVIVYFADHDSATTLGSSDVLPSQATPRVPAPTLRKQWENENGVPWPSDPVTGRNQDVAHDIPLADGGTNELDNYGPRPHGEHVDDHKQKGDFKRWGRRGGPKLPGILGGSVGGVVNSRPCN